MKYVANNTVTYLKLTAQMGSKLRICRACLSTEVALFNIHKNDLANVFEQFAGVTVNISDGFPPYLCMLCIRLLQRYSGYRLKTQLANEVLKKIINKNSNKKIKHLQKINFLNLQTTNVNVISYIPDKGHVNIIEEERISDIDEESSCFEIETLDEELINEDYDVTDFKSENSIETITSSFTDDVNAHDGLVYDEIGPIFVINNIKNKCESVNGEETVCEELSCDEKVESKNDRKAKSPTFTEDDKSQSYNGYSKTSDEVLINKEYDETDFRSQNSIDTINSSCTDDKKTHNGLVNDNFFAINNINNKNVTVNGEEIVSDELSFEESVLNESECDKTDVETENDRKTETTTRTDQEKSQSDKEHSKISSISAINGTDNKNVIVLGGKNVGEVLLSEGSAQKNVENSETKVVTDINKEVATSTHTVNGTTKVAISVIRNMIVIDGEKKSERIFSESKVKKKRIRKRAPKRDKDDPMSEKLPHDFEIDDKYKTATLRYSYRPTHVITRGHMEKRLQDLEQFSKIYRVNIKFMSKEEQLAVLHERTKLYKDCPYRCKLCLIGFRTPELYTSHVMKVHDPARGDYACDVCGNRFKSLQLKEKHVNLSHLKRFTCQLCGKVTKSQSFAKAHHALHKDSTTDEIPKKKRSYAKAGDAQHKEFSIDRIWRYKYDPKPIKCPICKDDFLGKIGVGIHAQSAHRQMVTCSDCGAHFENKNLLVKHLGDRCSPDDSPCPMCGLNFSSETLMMKHFEDTHRGFYKCGHCDMSFTSKFQYSAHQNEIRKKERSARKSDYMCEVCGKNYFKDERSLLNHQLVHSETRPYKCSLCPKTFTKRGSVKLHMRSHSNERRYKCPTCSKGFFQQAHRDAHILTHTKEKPYKCHICPKAYTGSGSLKEHVDTTHKGMPPRKRSKH